jgi:hypothetical protein
MPGGRRPYVAGLWPAAGYRPQPWPAAGYAMAAAGYGLRPIALRPRGYGLRPAGYGLRPMACGRLWPALAPQRVSHGARVVYTDMRLFSQRAGQARVSLAAFRPPSTLPPSTLSLSSSLSLALSHPALEARNDARKVGRLVPDLCYVGSHKLPQCCNSIRLWQRREALEEPVIKILR